MKNKINTFLLIVSMIVLQSCSTTTEPTVETTEPIGRELKVILGSDEPPFCRIMTPRLLDVKCTATSDGIVVNFDLGGEINVNGDAWPLLIRLYDRNGCPLTHFITAEKFTTDQEIFTFYRSKNSYLLTPKGNSISYTINQRELRDAEIIEMGFYWPYDVN